MTRISVCIAMSLLLSVFLAAQPVSTQNRGDDGEGSEAEGRGNRDKSRLDYFYEEFSKAMTWELKTNMLESEQISLIIKKHRRQQTEVKSDDLDAQVKGLRAKAREANEANDRELAEKFREQKREIEHETTPLPPEMFYEIADVLNEPLLTEFWQIAERFTKVAQIRRTGAGYLESLAGLALTQEQSVAISNHYKTFMDEMHSADEHDRDAQKEVLAGFLKHLRAELTHEQLVAFEEAKKLLDSALARKPREQSRRW